MGQSGAGYTVDPGVVQQGGRTACELAADLGRIRSTWAAATDEPGDACGYRETTAAYLSMQDAWFAELGVYIRVLEEQCQALEASARTYRAAETGAASRMRAL
jgi:uncharacterized protein YukE